MVRAADGGGADEAAWDQFMTQERTQRVLEMFHDESLIAARPKHQKAWVPEESERLQALAYMQKKIVEAVSINTREPLDTATIDHDATIIEAHKKQAFSALRRRSRVSALGVRVRRRCSLWRTNFATATCRPGWTTSD